MSLLSAQEGIRDLAGRYTDALNRWDLDAMGSCFTEDGVWDVVGMMKGEGRADVIRVLSEARSQFDWVFQLLQSVIILEHAPGRARARVYASEWSHVKGRPTLFYGLYNDDCV